MNYHKYQADYLFDGNNFRDKADVLVVSEDGTIADIVPLEEAGEDVQTFSGILCPGFINCHCHLELSHLKGIVPKQTGLVDFIQHILSERGGDEEQMLIAMDAAEQSMLSNGIVAVGDISNLSNSLPIKLKQRLYYHHFIEVSGFSPAIAHTRFQAALAVYKAFAQHFPFQTSLVPHAPYSVSPELFALVGKSNGNRLSSMHNQETLHENEFFKYGSGAFNQLYQNLGVDIASFYQPSGKSSLQTILPRLDTAQPMIFVHNTCTDAEDIAALQQHFAIGLAHFCLCPNANIYIENQLPNIPLLINSGFPIVLGTDSLASNEGLSILDEMKTIQQHFPAITLDNLLRWATMNGANALQIASSLGSFEPDKKPGINLIQHIDPSLQLSRDSSVRVLH